MKRGITLVSSDCGVFRDRKSAIHEETLSSAERTQFALIRNRVKRANVTCHLYEPKQKT